MTYVGPSPSSVQVPRAQADLQVRFSRNPNAAPVNQYIHRIPVDRTIGLFARLDADERVRYVDTGGSGLVGNWQDGNPRPDGFTLDHEWVPFKTDRDTSTFRLGNRTIDQCEWDIVARHGEAAAEKQMTRKTRRVENLLTTPANVSHATATSLAGGFLPDSSEANGYIQKLVNAAVNYIQLATNGAVRRRDIRAVMGKNTGQMISESPEYKAWFKNWQAAEAFVQSKRPHDENTNLLPTLFGITPVVHDDIIITSVKGASSTTKRVFYEGLGQIGGVDVDDAIVFVVAPGNLMGDDVSGGNAESPVNAPNFATVLDITKEDMTTEIKPDDWDRVTMGGVTNDDTVVLSSPLTALLVRQCLKTS